MPQLYFKVTDLAVSYKGFSISGIDFELISGNIMGLLGRSGSGKSTIIKALLGLKKPIGGGIRFLVNGESKQLRDYLGYSPQHNSLYPFLTVEENLNVFGKLHSMKKSNIKERSDYLLKRLDLHHSKSKKITQLSGGMAKRADLAAALIHNPELIILDEPFSGLDISIRKLIWNMIRELASSGKIIIISSHLLTDIQRYCNKYGLIEGEVFYSTEELIKSIRNTKEKNFELFIESMFTKALLKE